MLAAAVVHLEALSGGQVTGGFGRAVHSLWHDHLTAVAPDAARELHHHAQTQPFTLSDLNGPRAGPAGNIRVSPGDRAWFRVTTLEPNLSAALNDAWLPTLVGTRPDLAGIPWSVLACSTTTEQHHWAGQDSYASLLSRAMTAYSGNERWQLLFHAPTTFHAGRRNHLPFPLPDSLLKSWLRRWNAFNDIRQHWEPDDRWRQALAVSGYGLRTVPVRYGRSLRIGCVGWYIFHARDLPAEALTVINTLATFAFFCGSGHHTTQGMGMTRLQVP